jgi:hypothetical protein
VLRGGYGFFRSRFDGNGLIQSLSAQPWASLVLNEGTQNYQASLQTPIPQSIPPSPSWTPYSPTTSAGFQGPSQNYQPSVWQRFSLGTQSQLASNLVLDVEYVGGRGTKLFENVFPNQAGLASPADPIRGQTDNNLTNIPLRVPYEGWSPESLLLNEPYGESWYNGLQTSLKKRFGHGLNFLASYTFARDLTDTQGGVVAGGFGGSIYGNQFTARQTNYGPEPFIREQRLVVSYSYELPHPTDLASFAGQALGGWVVSGVTTVQTGQRITATQANPTNVYGIAYDREDYTPGCKVGGSGSIESRIDNYFNANCFTTPPVIGDDGVATAFGAAPIGNIIGPREVDFDFAVLKNFTIKFPTEVSKIEFRSEFFNLFNHPIFASPSAAFGPGINPAAITATAVSPRVIQFALKWTF